MPNENQKASNGCCPVCRTRIVTDVDEARCPICAEPIWFWRGVWRLSRERVERARFP